MASRTEYTTREPSLRQLIIEFDNAVGDLGKKVGTQTRVFQRVLLSEKDLSEALRLDDLMHEELPDHRKALEITKGQLKQLERNDRSFQYWIRLERQMVEHCHTLIERFAKEGSGAAKKRRRWVNELDETVRESMESWIIDTKKCLERFITISKRIVGEERVSKIVPRVDKPHERDAAFGLVRKGGSFDMGTPRDPQLLLRWEHQRFIKLTKRKNPVLTNT